MAGLAINKASTSIEAFANFVCTAFWLARISDMVLPHVLSPKYADTRYGASWISATGGTVIALFAMAGHFYLSRELAAKQAEKANTSALNPPPRNSLIERYQSDKNQPTHVQDAENSNNHATPSAVPIENSSETAPLLRDSQAESSRKSVSRSADFTFRSSGTAATASNHQQETEGSEKLTSGKINSSKPTVSSLQLCALVLDSIERMGTTAGPLTFIAALATLSVDLAIWQTALVQVAAALFGGIVAGKNFVEQHAALLNAPALTPLPR